jgi:hypothetical protein
MCFAPRALSHQNGRTVHVISAFSLRSDDRQSAAIFESDRSFTRRTPRTPARTAKPMVRRGRVYRHREGYPRFRCSGSAFTSEASELSKISGDKFAFRFQAILSVLRTTASRAQYVESTPANQTMGSCASFVITKKAPLSQQWANEVSAPESLSKGYRLIRDNSPEVAVWLRTVKLSYFRRVRIFDGQRHAVICTGRKAICNSADLVYSSPLHRLLQAGAFH